MHVVTWCALSNIALNHMPLISTFLIWQWMTFIIGIQKCQELNVLDVQPSDLLNTLFHIVLRKLLSLMNFSLLINIIYFVIYKCNPFFYKISIWDSVCVSLFSPNGLAVSSLKWHIPFLTHYSSWGLTFSDQPQFQCIFFKEYFVNYVRRVTFSTIQRYNT